MIVAPDPFSNGARQPPFSRRLAGPSHDVALAQMTAATHITPTLGPIETGTVRSGLNKTSSHSKATRDAAARACSGRLWADVETIMRRQHAIPLIAAVMLSGAGAALADGLPTFERDGFPMTQHQIQTLGSDRVHQQLPASTLTWEGMPASPHQLSALRPKDEPRR